MKTDFLPFKEALVLMHKEAKKHGLVSQKTWWKYVRDGKRPKGIPSKPERIYKNAGWSGLSHWLGNNNRQGGQRIHQVNESFFKEWSCDMAYILGFWFADGSISYGKSGYRFRITQHKDDKYILLEILRKMEATDYGLSSKGNCFNIEINSEEIYRDIISLGGKERKSLDVGFPSIPKRYLPDFIRGYFDGDGCISRRGKSYSSNVVSGSLNFIDGLYRCLNENLDGFKGIVIEIPKMRKTINGKTVVFKKNYKLKMESYDTWNLGQFMYGFSIPSLGLRRKMIRFSSIPTPRRHYKKKEDVRYGLERIVA